MKSKLGILCTHPIQYYAPLFRYLAQKTEVEPFVFYCHNPNPDQQGVGFEVPFSWDVDLMSGYRYQWLNNKSKRPGLLNFNGYDTPEIVDIINREKFDAFLIQGWNTKSMWQAIRACWKTNTPLLVRSDSHLHTSTSFLKRAVKELIYPYFIKKFFACLAVGKWSEGYFTHYGAKRIIFSPHFVDNLWFAQESAKWISHASEIRQEFGIPLRSIVFLFAGKFEGKKRPLDFLRALEKVLMRNISNNKVHVLMVGDGALRKSCEEFARERSLPVSFAGFLNQTEMPKAYAASNVLVLPSDGRETWGLVVNEAMASGLPAIVSDQVGCGPDLLKCGQTGFTFPFGDTSSLADKMYQIIIENSVEEMGKNAKEHIANYSVDRAAQGVIQAVAQVESCSEIQGGSSSKK